MAVIEGDKALVRWCGVSGATQYQIKRSTAKNSGYQVVATVSGTQYRDSKVSSVGVLLLSDPCDQDIGKW